MRQFRTARSWQQAGASDGLHLTRRLAYVLLTLAVLLAVLSSSLHTVQADSTANDLIDAVNAVRASYGLVPYQVGPAVMKFAQDHADYMASIQSLTHQLADGSSPKDHSMTENIAYGSDLTTDDIIKNKWGDELHMHTMIGYTQGYIGAGVSVVDGTAYYSLIVINTGRLTGLKPGMATPATATKTAAGGAAATATPAAATVTATVPGSPTPEPATIEYEVQLGDTVWGIAVKYNASTDSIIALNDLNAKDPIIWVGQKLKVQPNYTATPTLPATETPTRTETLQPSATPTPSATLTLQPSPVPSETQPVEAAPIAETGGRGGFPVLAAAFLGAGLVLGIVYLLMARASALRHT